MSPLTVRSAPGMGPLEVTIYPVEGDPIEFALSSSATSRKLELVAGRYAVVARRPNGSRIRRYADVPSDKVVDLREARVEVAHDFMQADAERGLVASGPKEAGSHRDLGQARQNVERGVVGVLLRSAEKLQQYSDDIDPDAIGDKVYDEMTQRARRWLDALKAPRELTLCIWRLSSGRWTAIPADAAAELTQAELSAEFCNLVLKPGSATVAVGLIDDLGFGPIVAVAPFSQPLSLTFLAEGLSVHAHDRDRTPGGVRSPVALATPTQGSAADLLSALNAPSTRAADALWLQAKGGLGLDRFVLDASPHTPVEMLREKFQRPAEALIAAHYLLRFLPSSLPLAWADNLCRALPEAADGPVIAAWARMSGDGALAGPDIDREVAGLLTMALARPVVLFARTRLLLGQALRFAPEVAQTGLAAQEPFRRAGADAGGLEAFWGGHPTAGGRASPLPPGSKPQIVLDKRGFVAKHRFRDLGPERGTP